MRRNFAQAAATALDSKQDAIRRLLAVMTCLRDPEHGCPWDLAQEFASIAPYTLEEAYEVVGAIEAGDRSSLRGELGDLLLQVAYHSQLASEENSFTFDDAARDVTEKMIARHPHVFGEESVADEAAMRAKWEELKAAERRREAAASGREPSRLENLPLALPALTRAYKLQNRAARSGFDWPDSEDAAAKLSEEVNELNQALKNRGSDGNDCGAGVSEELGDVLFSAVNVARKMGIDPESVLRQANRKFEQRFRCVEQALAAEGKNLESQDLETLEVYWVRAKPDNGLG